MRFCLDCKNIFKIKESPFGLFETVRLIWNINFSQKDSDVVSEKNKSKKARFKHEGTLISFFGTVKLRVFHNKMLDTLK